LCAFFLFSTQGLRVRLSARHSLRPLASEGHRIARPGREIAPRERGLARLSWRGDRLLNSIKPVNLIAGRFGAMLIVTMRISVGFEFNLK
jgi:hypothetical protein